MASSDADATGFHAGAANGQERAHRHNGQHASEPPTEDFDFPYAGFTWMEGGIIVGVCLLFTALMFVTALTSSCCAPSSQADLMRGLAARLSYLFLWALSTIPIFWACVRLRPKRYGWGQVIAAHTGIALGIAFLVELAQGNMFSLIASMWPPEDTPDPTTHPVELLTSLQFLGELVPYLILLGIGMGRFEYLKSQARRERAQRLAREADQLRSQLTEARLDALRMQINPHFLFNTLHMVSTMAKHNPEGVQKATARLSEMLRYALSTSDQQEVPLDKELDMLDSYLEIQKLRLDERLDTRVEVESGARQALVPTLLLQPLAENAVKHGFEGRVAPSYLEVRARRVDNDLVLRVIDNGAGGSNGTDPVQAARQSIRSEDRHGLQNIAERLQGLYGEAASLQFEHADGGGLGVVIRLPFHTRAADTNLRVAAVEAE